MALLPPIHFQRWIDEHRHLLKPPVGNQEIWHDREFMVTVVGGPNARNDYHVDEGEEFFYQVEGDITVKVFDGGQPRDIPIREGEMFLLPPKIPHSPQRPAGTVGLVLERRRTKAELDGFLWFCPKCHAKVYEEFLHVTSLVDDIPKVFDRFYGNPQACTCKACGTRIERVKPVGD
jgi:3-hydroxyanthranilate 3,4-dioxygenase